ncbi:hypothetical protein [Flammeovirga aprica]|uniref:Transposase n=1 Tax=Flammeovirga aprica JL-4 TaxID=694437 RepID=A0A7X9XBM6_9BACT|nr:hypothetical protein [Flammeovirga aprica]NME70900.1 transposase [Flammeovirga aprica JL-4]
MHKAILNKYVTQYIPKNRKERKLKVPLWKLMKAIFYKIKTGVQWYLLPLKEIFKLLHCIASYKRWEFILRKKRNNKSSYKGNLGERLAI